MNSRSADHQHNWNNDSNFYNVAG